MGVIMDRKLRDFMDKIKEGRVYFNSQSDRENLCKVLCYTPYLKYIFLDNDEVPVIPWFIDGPDDRNIVIV